MADPRETHWLFGINNHISFPGGGDPMLMPSAPISTDEGCAAISDTSGTLLFYTDGIKLWDAAHVQISVPTLGGSPTSAHSAIIVPPCGSGSLYHIFAAESHYNPQALTHTMVSVVGSSVTVAGGPTPFVAGPPLANEQLAAVPHSNCRDFWVISLDRNSFDIFAVLVSGDAMPSASDVVTSPYGRPTPFGYCMRASPSGNLLAFTNTNTKNIELFSFDRSTGAATFHSEIQTVASPGDNAYGVEFSPNEQYLYFSVLWTGGIHRHTIANGTVAFASTAIETVGVILQDADDIWLSAYQIGALQLAPNGKIYGAKVNRFGLCELATPDLINPGFSPASLDASGNTLVLPTLCKLGLPTFTRIAKDCLMPPEPQVGCDDVAAIVNEALTAQMSEQANALPTCEAKKGVFPGVDQCREIELPKIAPTYHITYGRDKCDCIESDDVETFNLTICNPYSNVSFNSLVVNMLEVVDASGQPVALLPDGTPSIEIVPRGPICFGTIAPCSCVSREVSVRLRGAKSGEYHIRIKAICYDVCAHQNDDACFKFNVCRD